MSDIESNLLEESGVKPTANRVLVLRSLMAADSPRSLIELETELETMDRSSVLRVLSLLCEHGMVHVMEDGRGVSKYEVCRDSHHHDHDNHDSHDLHHAHFYCERCEKVYCLENVAVPHIAVPDGFEVRGVNFMLKGICKDCSHKM